MKLVFLGTLGRSFFLRSLNNRNIVEKKDYVFLDEKKELDTIKNSEFSIPKKNLIVSWNPDDSKIKINENASDKLLKALGKDKEILLVFGAGVNATYCLRPLIEDLLSVNVKIKILAVIPFQWEGSRRGKFQNSLEELKERKLEVRTVDNENIYTNVDNTITIKEAFSCVDNLIISEIKDLI